MVSVGITVSELAYLRILRERVPNATPQHVKTMLCLLHERQSYLTLEELEQSTKIHNGELRKIMRQFTAKRLVEREGCLFKKPGTERIVEIITC